MVYLNLKRLPMPLRWKYYMVIGTRMITQPITTRLRSAANRLRRATGVHVPSEWHELTEDAIAFNNALVKAEVTNFCLTLPPEYEKRALEAAVEVLLAQEEKIRKWNRALKALEAESVDVSASRLAKEPEVLADPFAPGGPLSREYLMRKQVSVTKYVPFMERHERERPWHSRVVEARREQQRRRFNEMLPEQYRDEALGPVTSAEAHHTLNVERRPTEQSFSGFSSNSTHMSDILGGSAHGACYRDPLAALHPSSVAETRATVTL